MGVRIVLAQNESIGAALRRFKKSLEREGITWDSKRRAQFVKSSQTRRAKVFSKKYKARKATLVAKMTGEQTSVSSITELTNAFWKKTGKP